MVNLKTLAYLRPLLTSRISANICKYSTNTTDAPVKFSASKAKDWKAEYTRRGTSEDDEIPWFQPIAITSSISIFLIYFCVLREENDVDELLGVSIYDRIDGLEEVQLRRSLSYNLEHGKDTVDIRYRLRELENLRKTDIQ